MKNVVIFGGSFDPVHRGHLALMYKMFNSLTNLYRFFIIPTNDYSRTEDHPLFKKHLFSGEERLLMIKSCYINPLHPFVFSDIEIKQENKAYTIDTIKTIINLLDGDFNIHLLIGADQAEHFSTWYKAKEISEMVTLWTYPRNDCIVDPNFKWNILNSEKYDISSSVIRKLLKINSKSSVLKKWLPSGVLKLIRNFLNIQKRN